MKNLRLVGIFGLLLLGAGIVFGQGLGIAPNNEPCMLDPLYHRLKQAYPNGVPGRALPSTEKVDEANVDLTYYVPVVVHVVHAYGQEMNVTPEQIHSQIDVLNEDFGRYGGGFNTDSIGGKSNLRFCLASIDPDGNPTLGYEYIVSQYATELDPVTEDTFLKRSSMWDPSRYLNVWTVRMIKGNYEGYTFLPEEVAGTVYDGIVVKYSSFGLFPYGSAGTYGKTMTHEVGHFFGLYHPWGLYEGFCGDGTDYCDDTPPVPDIYFSRWPSCDQPETCDERPRLVSNYMDYADDACQNMFTQCQVDRMLNQLFSYRGAMVSGYNVVKTGCESVSDSIPALEEVFIYPNPASNFLSVNVDIEGVGASLLELTDMTGRKVYRDTQASFGRGPIMIDVANFSQGIYVLHLKCDKAEVFKKVRIGN